MTEGWQYVNEGAPFRAEDGTRIGRGDIFVPTSRERARLRYKLRPVDGGPVEPPQRAARRPSPTPTPLPDVPRLGFTSTSFADDAAHALALELGLGDMAFAGAAGTGEGGAFTAADVRHLVGEPATEVKAGEPLPVDGVVG